MKYLLLLIGVLGFTVLRGETQPAVPLIPYFSAAEIICIAEVTKVEGHKITFTVSEILRGKSVPSMTLESSLRGNLLLKTEWLLVSNPQGHHKGSAGWPFLSDSDWVLGPVVRAGKTVYIQTSDFPPGPDGTIAFDKLPDGSQGLTLDHLKQLLQKQSTKS